MFKVFSATLSAWLHGWPLSVGMSTIGTMDSYMKMLHVQILIRPRRWIHNDFQDDCEADICGSECIISLLLLQMFKFSRRQLVMTSLIPLIFIFRYHQVQVWMVYDQTPAKFTTFPSVSAVCTDCGEAKHKKPSTAGNKETLWMLFPHLLH